MAAPIDNQFAIGNSGREKLFDSPDQLREFIQKYFDDCDRNPIYKNEQKKGGQSIKIGKDVDADAINDMLEISQNSIVKIPTQRPYTIEGLCIHLGNISRQTLLNYKKRKGYEEFFDVITWAKRKITENNIQFGLVGAYDSRLVQFLLINNDEYKQKVEETSKGELKIKWVEELTDDSE